MRASAARAVRYAGVLASASKLGARLAPKRASFAPAAWRLLQLRAAVTAALGRKHDERAVDQVVWRAAQPLRRGAVRARTREGGPT
jgi:hypothetical protein